MSQPAAYSARQLWAARAGRAT